MTAIRQRYERLEAARQPFLDRARDASKLTIPSLLPPDGHSAHSKLYTPFQGIGARGVNNLSSKMLLALLPPNSPFFRLTVDDFKLQELAQEEGARAEVEEALSSIERAVMSEIEASSTRIAAFEAIKHLLVAGNVLLYQPDKG
ncbi:portal protein, partial [Oceanospirillaceae bacterium]|nr:portal protein [Oceanospirillaceae bacterium]